MTSKMAEEDQERKVRWDGRARTEAVDIRKLNAIVVDAGNSSVVAEPDAQLLWSKLVPKISMDIRLPPQLTSSATCRVFIRRKGQGAGLAALQRVTTEVGVVRFMYSTRKVEKLVMWQEDPGPDAPLSQRGNGVFPHAAVKDAAVDRVAILAPANVPAFQALTAGRLIQEFGKLHVCVRFMHIKKSDALTAEGTHCPVRAVRLSNLMTDFETAVPEEMRGRHLEAFHGARKEEAAREDGGGEEADDPA